MGIEVLIPDFDGSDDRLRTVMDARPDILNHNLETVERLQKPVRKRARWDRTLFVLEGAKRMAREIGKLCLDKGQATLACRDQRLPEKLNRSPDQASRRISTISFMRLTLSATGTPKARNSSSRHPIPNPGIVRPPES